jgi:hypothetical protein
MIYFLNKYNLYSDETVKVPGQRAKKGGSRVHTDHGNIGNSTAKTYRFCTSILLGKYDSQLAQISGDFVRLIQHPDVMNLIAWETKKSRMVPSFDQIDHDDEIYNNIQEASGPRGYDTEDKVLSSITLIYWTLVVKRYVETGRARNDNIKFVRTLQTTQSVANGIIRDSNNRDEFMRALRSVKAGGGQQTVRHDVGQTAQPVAPTSNAPEITREQLIREMNKIRQMIPDDFEDYADKIGEQVKLGKSAQEIISMLNSGQLDESRSRILKGILG